MKIKQQIIRHGEVILKPINILPKKAQINNQDYKIIIAHSETGHHHILEVENKVGMSKIKVYTWNGKTYLEVPEIAELWHQKTGKNVHTAHKVIPGVYEINIKKEFDYFSGLLKQVRD